MKRRWPQESSFSTTFFISQGDRNCPFFTLIAAGVCAFVPRALKLDGASALRGQQLHYQLDQPAAHAGRRLLVLGGDDLALSWLLQLAELAPAATGELACSVLVPPLDRSTS